MIPAERAHLRASAISHPGMSGKNNEDRYAVAAFWTEGERPVPVVFAIVSDGIGGHQAGEIAAEMVVETVSQGVANSNGSNPIQTLRESIMRASQQILVKAESETEKKGMGATSACVLVLGDRLYIAYVGDSRIYLIRNQAIQQLSVDHTWVQEAIDAGVIDPEQGKDHPNAHVIRRYLGSKQPVEPDTRLRLDPKEDHSRAEANQGLHLRPRDLILLCSDGLTDLVEDHEILSTLESQDQESAIQQLVDLANKRGGHDNITLVTLRVPETLPDATQPISLPAEIEKKPRSKLTGLVLLLAVSLFIIAALGFYYFSQRGVIDEVSPSSTATSVQGLKPTTANTREPAATAETPPSITQTTQAGSGNPTRESSNGTPWVTLTPWPTNTGSP